MHAKWFELSFIAARVTLYWLESHIVLSYLNFVKVYVKGFSKTLSFKRKLSFSARLKCLWFRFRFKISISSEVIDKLASLVSSSNREIFINDALMQRMVTTFLATLMLQSFLSLSAWFWIRLASPDWSKVELYYEDFHLVGVFALLSTIFLYIAGLNASKLLHFNMLFRVLRAPMHFFDQTPTGRLISRFSKDVDVMDGLLIVWVTLLWRSYFFLLCLIAGHFQCSLHLSCELLELCLLSASLLPTSSLLWCLYLFSMSLYRYSMFYNY